MDDFEKGIAGIALARTLPAVPRVVHPDDYGQRGGLDQLGEIANILRILPAEKLWEMCNGMKRPELDKVLVAWAIAYLDGKDFEEPARIERRL